MCNFEELGIERNTIIIKGVKAQIFEFHSKFESHDTL